MKCKLCDKEDETPYCLGMCIDCFEDCDCCGLEKL